MLEKIFNYDNVVFRFIDKIGSIWWLNILWIICSIPIFTIGASTSALMYSCMKLRKNEGYVTKNFFKSFKENFFQGCILGIIYIVVGIFLAIDLIYWNKTDSSSIKLTWIMTVAILVPYCLTLLYVFAIQAKFVNTVIHTIEYAFMIAIKNFKYTIAMAVIIGVIIYFNVTTIFLVNLLTLNFGISIIAYVCSFYYLKIFEKYISNSSNEEGVDNL